LAQTFSLLIGVVACAALAACAVGPDYQPPVTPMPATFVAAPAKTAKLASGRRDAVWSTPHNGGALCATVSSNP
jgi:hypothetical protein